MKKHLKILGIALVVVIILILVLLNYTRTNVNTNQIKIGVIAPLTGDYAAIGESFMNAVKMSAGDDPRLKIIFENDQFDAKVGLSAFQKLVNVDGVDLIINMSSPTLEAITSEVTRKNLPAIQIFESKTHVKDSIFQMLPFSYALYSALGKLAESKYEKIALVYGGSQDLFKIDADYFKKGLTNQEVVVAEEKISNNTDFRSEVTKILAKNPDAVTNFLTINDGIRFIKQINIQKGDKKVDIICDANMEMAINDYIKALGTSTFEGCVSTNLPNLTTNDFKISFEQKYKKQPIIAADWGYDAITIVKKLKDYKKDQWVKIIQGLSFEGVSGPVSFDENGTRTSISESHIFKNGTFIKI